MKKKNKVTPFTRKDRCYYKVKKQYMVVPSDYASGAIAKRREKKAK